MKSTRLISWTTDRIEILKVDIIEYYHESGWYQQIEYIVGTVDDTNGIIDRII